jgi:hypothetical protein
VFFANAVDHDCRNEARPYLSAAGEIRRVDEETPLRTRQPLRSVIRLNNKTDSTPDCEFTPHPGATKLRYATRIIRAEPTSNKTSPGPTFDGNWLETLAPVHFPRSQLRID